MFEFLTQFVFGNNVTTSSPPLVLFGSPRLVFFRSMYLLLLWSVLPAALNADDSEQPVNRPNIILINLDDADSSLLTDDMLEACYPAMKELAAQSIRFTNMHATTPYCAPSRAALMRGQYAFSTALKVNSPAGSTSNNFPGGYGEFTQLGYQDQELGVWMKDAGYRTMHVGKFHHSGFDKIVPPGWDDFILDAGCVYHSTSRFSTLEHPEGRWKKTGPEDYIIDVDAADSAELIKRHTATRPDQPFFLYLAPIAPHYPAEGDETGMVSQRHESIPVPPFTRRPDFNEPDMTGQVRTSPTNAAIQQIRAGLAGIGIQ